MDGGRRDKNERRENNKDESLTRAVRVAARGRAGGRRGGGDQSRLARRRASARRGPMFRLLVDACVFGTGGA